MGRVGTTISRFHSGEQSIISHDDDRDSWVRYDTTGLKNVCTAHKMFPELSFVAEAHLSVR
jgi:hypothetical protein